jgi:hypothetical protein
MHSTKINLKVLKIFLVYKFIYINNKNKLKETKIDCIK